MAVCFSSLISRLRCHFFHKSNLITPSNSYPTYHYSVILCLFSCKSTIVSNYKLFICELNDSFPYIWIDALNDRWVGGQWTGGYISCPLLCNNLPPTVGDVKQHLLGHLGAVVCLQLRSWSRGPGFDPCMGLLAAWQGVCLSLFLCSSLPLPIPLTHSQINKVLKIFLKTR